MEYAFQTNPVLAEGRLYITTGTGIIIALAPASGEELWRYDPQFDRSRSTSEISNRGVTSWLDPNASADARCRHRIITGTLDARMIQVDGAPQVCRAPTSAMPARFASTRRAAH